jgi:hypothetical protein
MRVTIEHREQTAGIAAGNRNYFVDCTVEFSEEEKAIIKARALGDTVVTSGLTSVPVGTVKGVSPYLLRAAAPIMIIGGFIFGVAGGGTFAGLIVFAGFGFLIYGFVAPRLHDKRSSVQDIKIRDILNRYSFSLFAFDPVEAKTIDARLREELAGLKSFLVSSAEVPSKKNFEL